jgi:MoaA/NifB/PqqE/SkfB family radical SAM enzyme
MKRIRVLDPDIRSKIVEIGAHPFLMVRLENPAEPNHRYIICETQNELPRFLDEIAYFPGLPQCQLLSGLERALRLEMYEAAECWFSWVQGPFLGPTESVYLDSPPADNAVDYGYPIYGVGSDEFGDSPEERSGDSSEQRLEILTGLLEAYWRTDGNNATRFLLAEALAFAMSRCLGSLGRYAESAAIVDRALILNPKSIHLKAARSALGLKLEGKMVPDRLVKFIGADNGYLKQFVCPHPFEHFEITPSGDVLVCCGHWLPTSIGNFLRDPIDVILNSNRAQKIRQSMTDGSYKYCNHLDCGRMIQGTLPFRDELERPATRRAIAERNYRMEGVDYLTFGFDQTCNLSCPSCRTHRIVEKTSASVEKARAVEEKLIGLLPTIKVLQINPAGEIFASKPSRKLLELINDERCPDLRVSIISNGTLFSEEEWNKFPGIHNKIRSIRISVDAARKETFEKLRRLGRYEPFLENMRFLRQLRRSGIIPELKFSFTYQVDNFREMPEFVDFCESMNCDFAIFERLQNIAFSWDEFRSKAVHYSDHPLYPEFIGVVSDPRFASPRVWHDFDYREAAKMPMEEARQRTNESHPIVG